MLMNKRLKRTVPKFASSFEMEFDEEKKSSRSHAEMFSATEIMQTQLLHQMQCSCVTVQDVGARMEGRFAEKEQKRRQQNLPRKTEIQKENQLLKTEMCARMDEGLKKRRRTPDTWYRMTQSQ